MMGCSNEAPVIIDAQETMALIDSSAEVSSVSSQFCEELALNYRGQGMPPSLSLSSWRSTSRSQGCKHYNEDVLLLVIPTMTYSQMVPVMVPKSDRTLSMITKGELEKVTTTWRQAHFGAVMSGLLQLSHKLK